MANGEFQMPKCKHTEPGGVSVTTMPSLPPPCFFCELDRLRAIEVAA